MATMPDEAADAGAGTEAAATASRYLDAIDELLARARRSNQESIPAAAAIVATTVERGAIIQTFGTGHSQLLALEVAGRAGGYAGVQVIFDPGMGRSEQVEGFATTLLRDLVWGPNDCLIVVSNSGRNPAPIDIALEGRRAGLPLIAVTALDYSRSSQSRHSSGKRLFELADVVLDTCGAPGDAAIQLEGSSLRVGPTSTVVGAALLQAVLAAAAEELLLRGLQPAVFRSQNTDDAAANNDALRARYRGRVRPLG